METKPRSIVAKAAFWLSLPLLLAAGADLMAGHLVTLPKPSPLDPTLVNAIKRTHPKVAIGKWRMIHFLYGECRCSGRVLDRLVQRRARGDVAESIVLVGAEGADAARARAAGYPVELVTPPELKARWGVEAAPLLVVTDPAGRALYVGGYTNRKQSPRIRDEEILEALRKDHPTDALPTFGCAVAEDLKRRVDPLGLR